MLSLLIISVGLGLLKYFGDICKVSGTNFTYGFNKGRRLERPAVTGSCSCNRFIIGGGMRGVVVAVFQLNIPLEGLSGNLSQELRNKESQSSSFLTCQLRYCRSNRAPKTTIIRRIF